MARSAATACQFADKCARRSCLFAHPSGPLCPVFPAPCNVVGVCRCRHPPSGANVKQRAPCRHGDACTNPECKFDHAGGPLCRFFTRGSCKPPEGKSCPFRHPVPPIREATAQQPVRARPDSAVPAVDPVASKGKTTTARKPECRPTPPPPPQRESKGRPTTPTSVQTARAPQPDKRPPPQHLKKAPFKPLKPAPEKAAGKPRVDRVQWALAGHERAVQAETRQLQSLLATANQSLGLDEQHEATCRAHRARLEELRDQQAVFLEVTDRINQPAYAALLRSERERDNLLKREVYRFHARLPALAKRLQIEAHLANPSCRFTVIQGQTGSGKSTQIPQYAADLPCFAGKRIICSQPRKLAATSLATRVAFEYAAGWSQAKPGRDVGFRVGGKSKCFSSARIEYVTEALLLDMIARARRSVAAKEDNPFRDVGCVVVDEAHERSITCDLIMGSLKENHPSWRHVKVAITSATIDLNLFSSFFENAPIVEIPGRMFPVDVQYIAQPGQRSSVVDAAKVASVVADCALMIQVAFPDPADGDVLCFLPGQDDVLRAKDVFERRVQAQLAAATAGDAAYWRRVQAHALYGKQHPDEQARVFEQPADKSAPRQRRVIFATDVAETSITIDGVVFVVDSGLRKAMVYDPVRNMSSLQVQTVSRSSALQRAGRAGRTRPGKCFRLYSQQEFQDMEIGKSAEIFQQPLTLALLTLQRMSIDPRTFHWIEPPTPSAMDSAEQELVLLGALDAERRITSLGRLVAEVQVDPKIVRMIDRADRLGCEDVGIDLAAVLSVANIFYYRGDKKDKRAQEQARAKQSALLLLDQGDVVTMFRAYRAWKAVLEGDNGGSDEPNASPPLTGDGSTPSNRADVGDDEDEDEDSGEWHSAIAANINALSTKRSMVRQTAPGFADDGDDGDAESLTSVDDADNDDLMSVQSVESEDYAASTQSGSSAGASADQPNKPKKRLNESRAKAWCIRHSVNAKAVGIARAAAKELRRTLNGAPSRSRDSSRPDQTSAVSDDTVRRLLVAGYFLNASVAKPVVANKHVRYPRPQYFALDSGVLGCVFLGSAIDLLAKQQQTLPSWVIFDSILRLKDRPFLTLVTPIEGEWIREECPDFHAVCMQKAAELPIATLEWTGLSMALLRGVFGKAFRNLSRWEAQLQCTLSLDRDAGTLVAACAPVREDAIRSSIDSKIEFMRRRLESDTTEETYMGATRAVIGPGFLVQQLLFGSEFLSLTLRNLRADSDRDVEARIRAWAAQASCPAQAIRCVDVLRHSDGAPTVTATVKFTDKTAAQSVYDRIRGDHSGVAGEAVTVSPLRALPLQSKEAIDAHLAGCARVTWADGAATGGAKLFFRSASEANEFIAQAPTVLGCTASAVGGAKPAQATPQVSSNARATTNPQAQTPTKKDTCSDGSFRFVFDLDEINSLPLEQQVRLRFGVLIKSGLPVTMDEVELATRVRPANVAYCKILRKPVAASAARQDTELEVRFRRMLPLLSCLDDTAVHTDFVDKARHRAGVVVNFRDLDSLQQTFETARASPLWGETEKPHQQPIRMEIEYSFSTTVHSDLHHCFRRQLAEIIAFAQAKGVTYQFQMPTASLAASSASKNMVVLSFVGERRVLERVRAKLDDVLACEKVDLQDMMILFSLTGRLKLERWMAEHASASEASGLRYFVRWINKKRELWVYGDADSRRHVCQRLQQLAAELSALDVLDRVVRLNLKNLPKEGIKPWLKQCAAARLLYFHVVTRGNRSLMVSGTDASVQAFVTSMRDQRLLYEPRRLDNEASKPDCGVCYMPVEDPYVSLTLCSHVFCLDCLQPMVQATTQLPFVCPAPSCARALHVDDILKIASDTDTIHALVESAVFDFVARSDGSAMVCVQPGCNQILSTSNVVGTEETPGGRCIYCDHCEDSYCLDCTATANRPVVCHSRQSCKEFRSRQPSPQVAQHMRAIREQILNLTCPHCSSVFLDFNGCTSVQCGNPSCSRYFCANCLIYVSSSSGDTHEHVARCPSNPNPASYGGRKGYFVSDEQLAATHGSIRTRKLAEYFEREILNAETRFCVYRRLKSDLADLGIDVPVHLQGTATAEALRSLPEEIETAEDKATRQWVQHIREKLLNLRCPGCDLVFVDFDFDSCAALTCANPHCKRSFCAYCLADCGADAHAHVSQCKQNPNRPYYYVTEAEFHQVHKVRRERLIYTCLRDVKAKDGDQRVQLVVAALATDFGNHGLDITTQNV
ncbi:hypothetical protein ATCC90586_004931 [Pythium insidiosum]|nr:hypothetical protein ATCC90586_004931 [Pythium insidiosum]